MKIYICGKSEEDLTRGEQFWQLNDHRAFSSNMVKFPFTDIEKKHFNFKIIDMCDCIYMTKGWKSNERCKTELAYAKAMGKLVKYEDMQWSLRKKQCKIKKGVVAKDTLFLCEI